MSKTYSITFDPNELDQLLTVLYGQTVIADNSAIRLIAKINSEVHHNSPLNPDQSSLLANSHLDMTLENAETTYHRYRVKHLTSATLPIDPEFKNQELKMAATSPDSLTRIAQSLEFMANHLSQGTSEPLGFSPQKRILYAENAEGIYWHGVDAQQQIKPIAAQILTCKVNGLTVRKGKSNAIKICLSVQADQLYEVEIPYHSLFCKTLLLALDSLSPSQFRLPLTIEPFQSPKHRSAICQVYCQGSRIHPRGHSKPNWRAVIEQIQQNLSLI
ncbi:MAG: hypothetical protein ACO3NK_04885 [Prochlorotrichaceae cyanobacterium]|jgi:hypothetical protein